MKSIYTPKEAAVYIARHTGDLDLTERDIFERIKEVGLSEDCLSVVITTGTALQYQTGGNVDEWQTYAMPTPRELFVGGHFAVDFVEQLSLTGFGLPGQLSNALLPPHNQRFSTTTPIPAADVRLPKRLVINLLSPYHRLILDIESGEINLDHAFTEINDKANAPTVVQSNPAPAVEAMTLVVASGNVKRWTTEKLAELKAYRDTHKMTETVAKFGISEQLIRKKLPRGKPKATPFSELIHRSK